ncbi:MAG: GDSL-type esterase/lipase family protein [Kiritimatiellia bacterium]
MNSYASPVMFLPKAFLVLFLIGAAFTSLPAQLLPRTQAKAPTELPASLKPEAQQRDSYIWADRHAAVLERNKTVKPEVVFFGDSITHFWGGEPNAQKYNIGADSWDKLFKGHTVTNLGFGFDYVDNAYFRVQNGELEGISPKIIIVCIGTNNLGHRKDSAQDCAANTRAFVQLLRTTAPQSKILLLGIYPRREAELAEPIRENNQLIAKLADNKHIFFADVGRVLLSADKKLANPKLMRDTVHPNAEGYRCLAAEIAKKLAALNPQFRKGALTPLSQKRMTK